MLFVFLGSRGIPLFALLGVCYILPCYVYRQWGFFTSVGQLALSFAFVVMSIFYTLNLWRCSVVLGSIDAPLLLYDAKSFHTLSHDIAHHAMGEQSPIVPYLGYPLFLSWWIKAGINDIAYPIAINILLTLCSIILVGRCTLFLIDNKNDARKIASYAMMLTAIIPGVMANATVLLKESFVTTAILATLCSILTFKQGSRHIAYIAMFLLGILVLTFCRTTYLYIVGLFLVAIYSYRMTINEIVPMVGLCLMIAACVMIGSMNSWWGDNSYVMNYVTSNDYTSFFSGESQKPLEQLLGPYSTYPLYVKILLWPFTIAIQFIIPFPFATTAPEVGEPFSTSYHRMSYLWYMAALPILVYYITHWFRQGKDVQLSIWATTAAIAYCIPALITGGSISRYAFCFVPLLTIMGGYVIHNTLQQRKIERMVVIFSGIYVALLALALVVGANPHIIL